MSRPEERKYFPLLDKRYATGQELLFKKDVTAYWEDKGYEVMWIESPTTATGAPDVLLFIGNFAFLFEFKVSDNKGFVTFEKTQPLYYRQHPTMPIKVMAYDVQAKQVIVREAKEVLAYISTYTTLHVPLSSIQTRSELRSAAWKTRHPTEVKWANRQYHSQDAYNKVVTEKRRQERQEHPEVFSARNAVRTALANGSLVRPTECARCHRQCKPDAHHTDYNKPFTVVWLCKKCHGLVHNGARLEILGDKK